MAAGGPGPAQVRPRGPFNRVPAGGAAAFSFFAVLLRLGGSKKNQNDDCEV